MPVDHFVVYSVHAMVAEVRFIGAKALHELVVLNHAVRTQPRSADVKPGVKQFVLTNTHGVDSKTPEMPGRSFGHSIFQKSLLNSCSLDPAMTSNRGAS